MSVIQNLHWLKNNVEDFAVSYTIKNILVPYRQECAAKKKLYLDKLERELKTRLRSEISYWDERANDLSATDKLNSEQARRRADELANQLNRRLAEITLERKILTSPPVVVGGALIVPRGYFKYSAEKNFATDVVARSRIEKIAMETVMKIERELGNVPSDVSNNKCGYDIESREKQSGRPRFIEVKGRASGADTVTVTKNEILTALNSPENFILAIVTVDNNSAHVVYLKTPFTSPPDFAVVSSTYKISSLMRQGKILLEKNLNMH